MKNQLIIAFNGKATPYAEHSADGRLTGFARDLMDEISTLKGFNYSLELTPGGSYGFILNGVPNGMIGYINRSVSEEN